MISKIIGLTPCPQDLNVKRFARQFIFQRERQNSIMLIFRRRTLWKVKMRPCIIPGIIGPTCSERTIGPRAQSLRTGSQDTDMK